MPLRAFLALLAIMLSAGLAQASGQDCVPATIVLWGDGRHDDTKALNAWLRGANALWGESGAPVGDAIAGRRFRLSAPVYVPAGTGRALEDFRMSWPERGETVSGGVIRAGSDPDRAPALAGVDIVGGDAGEGKPFEVPDPVPAPRQSPANCATS